ncbi:hypothetical protein NP233_g12415 [Leucocoprinus birnbaumii]|uniref:NACHT domain-containing protein n=1 Tax=Leucocoprinus birnbaumii TaxID=56174 RepID=A0AAD5YQ19_9AGAR|nr:hypothetical protein NP233_g12415 [Leucocoprinus birnbaumii]
MIPSRSLVPSPSAITHERLVHPTSMNPVNNIEETMADPSMPRSPMLPPTVAHVQQVMPPDLITQDSSPCRAGNGFLTNAHNFAIKSAVFVNNLQIEEEVHLERRVPDDEEKRAAKEYKKRREEEEREWERRGEEALQRLERSARPDAMLNRIERAGYVPRCDDDTRESLRDRLTDWGLKIGAVEWSLIWLFGPAGVGKSAVAQSIGEALRKEESFGAGFFFSRPNNRSDPDDLICDYARSDYHRRVRWMICSRPDPQITATFDALKNKTIHRRERLDIDDPDAQNDAFRILEKGFIDIRTSGHLGFASFVLRFIGDTRYNNPDRQLDTCLKFLEDARKSSDRNPLLPLDLLYTRIFSDIPNDTLPNTLLVLGVLILHGNEECTAHILASFLGLNQAAFYSALHHLHSVLLIPTPDEAHKACIRVYHASFSDFVKDKARSGQYSLDEDAVQLHVATRGLKWLSDFGHYLHDHVSFPELHWVSDLAPRQMVIEKLSRFAFAPTWRAFPRVSEKKIVILEQEIQNFDFSLIGREHLRWYSEDDMQAFGYFIRWLLSSKMSSLVRLDLRHSGKVGKKNEIMVVWNEKDPSAFIQSLMKSAGPMGSISSLHVEIRAHRRTMFHLVLSTSPHHAEEYSENDIVIILVGDEDSGQSDFIDCLTQKTQKERSTLRLPPPRSGPIQATRVLHPKYGNRVVLINSSAPYPMDNLASLDGFFMDKRSKGVIFSALLYLHPLEGDFSSSELLSMQTFYIMSRGCNGRSLRGRCIDCAGHSCSE